MNPTTSDSKQFCYHCTKWFLIPDYPEHVRLVVRGLRGSKALEEFLLEDITEEE